MIFTALIATFMTSNRSPVRHVVMNAFHFRVRALAIVTSPFQLPIVEGAP
jgi:hypothetical protein